MDMYKEALKQKLRFPTKKGDVMVEDLWDLPLTSAKGASLDDTAKQLNRSLKESSEESFVTRTSPANKPLELAFSIVKDVINDRIKQKEDAENAAARKAKKQKILELIESKQDQELAEKSVSDLEVMLSEL